VGAGAQKGLKFDDGSFAPLGATWRYKVSTTIAQSGLPPTAPWVGTSGLSTLRNGMIAPLIPYGLKGFAWYQGEANVAEPAAYARLLPALVADWRRSFGGPDLPFLVVQLADFGPRQTTPVESGWAGVRDVQRRAAAADPKVGLASAVDIGDIYDIHPANKQQVGHRLALQARKLAYGETGLVAAGPAPAVGDIGRRGRARGGRAAGPAGGGPGRRPAGRVRAVRRGRRLPLRRRGPGRRPGPAGGPGRLRAGQGPLRLGRQPDPQPVWTDRTAGDPVRIGDRALGGRPRRVEMTDAASATFGRSSRVSPMAALGPA
jgi:hypothetical protein